MLRIHRSKSFEVFGLRTDKVPSSAIASPLNTERLVSHRASLTVTCIRTRRVGSIVVDHNCSGIISQTFKAERDLTK
jgi:hypothetical protein